MQVLLICKIHCLCPRSYALYRKFHYKNLLLRCKLLDQIYCVALSAICFMIKVENMLLIKYILLNFQVSATKCGLLPISSEAAILGEISYCDFHGVPFDQSDRDLIARSLGIKNKVFFLVYFFLLITIVKVEWRIVSSDFIHSQLTKMYCFKTNLSLYVFLFCFWLKRNIKFI